MKTNFCLIAFLSLTLSISSLAQHNCMKMGVNIAMGCYWDWASPFNDIFLSADGWRVGWNKGPYKSVPKDTAGYPLQMPYDIVGDNPDAGLINVHTLMLYTGDNAWPLGDYTVYYDGDGDLDFGGAANARVKTPAAINHWVYTDPSGKVTGGKYILSIPHGNNGLGIDMTITRSQLGNHIHNIRVYYPDADPNQKFYTDYIKKVEPFYSLRFMDAFLTNSCPYVNWTDRPRQSTADNGMSYEDGIDLCNTAKKHAWVTVPHQASDDYLEKMAQLFKNRLDPNLDIYLEYSNEIWNFSLGTQFAYIRNIFWGDPHVDPADPWSCIPYGYTIKFKNMCRIWRKVFGDDSIRIKRVLAWQQGNMALLNFVKPDDFDYYSCSWYFGQSGQSASDPVTFYNQMTASWRSENSERTSIKHAVMTAHKWGKPFVFYEGGESLADDGPTQYSPQMYNMYQEVLDTISRWPGCEMALQYSFILYRPWGALYSPWDDVGTQQGQATKYKALIDYVAKTGNCQIPIQQTDTIGSGLSLSLNGQNNYGDISNGYKPSDFNQNYTIETWIKPNISGREGFLWAYSSIDRSMNGLKITTNNSISWTIQRGSAVILNLSTTNTLEINQWYHIAAVKNGSDYRIYINGIERAYQSMIQSSTLSFSSFTIGTIRQNGTAYNYFKGSIDEVRIWNKAITSISVLRDWMCKKITTTHPDFANLAGYYEFNVVTGTNIYNKKGMSGNLVNYSNPEKPAYIASGAPIGNQSTYIYASDLSGQILTITHPNGDQFVVKNISSGNNDGMHIYYTNQPDDNPPARYSAISNSNYYGVFIGSGSNIKYDVVYYYLGNGIATGNPNNLRLLKRNDNADINWRNGGAKLDPVLKSLTISCHEEYRSEYNLGIRISNSVKRAGAGMALSFNNPDPGQSESNYHYVNIPLSDPDDLSEPFKKLSRNFSIMFWAKGTGVAFSLKAEPYDWTGCFVTLYDNGTGSFRINNSTSPNFGGATPNAWNHFGFTFHDSLVTVFINGIQVAQAVNSGLVDKNRFSQLLLGLDIGTMPWNHGFVGMIDEFSYWNTTLSLTTIRTLMCRKINHDDPLACSNLKVHFNFDEGTGSLLENFMGSTDGSINRASWAVSGARIGDTSVYSYPALNLSILSRNGDGLSVSSISNATGIQLYRIDEEQRGGSLPVNILSHDSTRYWGVFAISTAGNASYTATYNYAKNPSINSSVENSLRLLTRPDNTGNSWLDNPTVSPNTTSKTITKTAMSNTNNGEYILGGTLLNSIIINTSVPAQPGSITGPTSVCKGQSNIIYSVPQVSGVAYQWKLPTGFSGYSTTNTITLNSGNSNGGTMSVVATNQFGTSIPQTITININNNIDIDALLEGSTICSGTSGIITIHSSQSGVTYQAYKANNAIGSTVTGNNGNDIQLIIPSANLSQTTLNEFSIQASQGVGCSVTLNNIVRVNVSPNRGLMVQSHSACGNDTAKVSILDSEIGVFYYAVDGNGNSVSDTAQGGGLITIKIKPQYVTGTSKTFNIRAYRIGCAEVTLLNQAIISITNINTNNLVSTSQWVVCADNTYRLQVANSEIGVNYVPIMNNTQVTGLIAGTGGTLTISISTGSWSSPPDYGRNTVYVQAIKGSCSVLLNDTATLFKAVGSTTANGYNTIRTENFGQGSGSAFNYVWSTPVTVCQGAQTALPQVYIQNASKGVFFQAYIGDNPVSDVYEGNANGLDGVNLLIYIPANRLSPGANTVRMRAFTAGCNNQDMFLPNTTTVNLSSNSSPDITLDLTGGGSICAGATSSIIVRNAQVNTTYVPVTPQGLELTASITNGSTVNNLTFNLPANVFSNGTTVVKMKAKNTQCPFVILTDSTTFSISNADRNLTVYGGEFCASSSRINIMASQTGMIYTAYKGNNVVSLPINGNGSTLSIFLFDSAMSVGNNNISVKVKSAVINCDEASLFDTANVSIVGTVTLPTVADVNYNVGDAATALTATGSNLVWYTTATGGSGSATAPIPATTVAGTTSYYVTQSVGTCESSRARINVIVQPNTIEVAGRVIPSTTICAGTTGTVLYLVANTEHVIRWESSTDGSNWNQISNTTNSYTLPALTQTTYFQAVLQGSSILFSARDTITVEQLPVGGTILGSDTISVGNTSGTMTLTGYSGTIVRWQYAQSPYGPTDWKDTAVTSLTFISQPLTKTTRFRAVVKGTLCGEVTSNYATIEVLPNNAGYISGGTNICYGASGVQLELHDFIGKVEKWQYAVSPYSNRNNIPIRDSIITTSPLYETTMFWAVVVSPTGDTLISQPDTIVVLSRSNSGIINGPGAVVQGATAILSVTGHNGIVLVWQEATLLTGLWNNIPSSAFQTSITRTLNESMRYRVLVQNGTCISDTSDVLMVTATGNTGLLSVDADTVCSGSNTVNFTLTNCKGTVVSWLQSLSSNGPWSVFTGTGTTNILTNLTQPTYIKVAVNSGSQVDSSNVIIVHVSLPTLPGSLTQDKTAVCENSDGGTISLSGNIGSVQRWLTSTDGVIWNNINNTVLILNAGIISQTTYYSAIVKNGLCAIDTTASIKIIASTLPKNNLTILGDNVCLGGTAHITIQNREAGITYELGNAGQPVGATSDSSTLNYILEINNLTANTNYDVTAINLSGCRSIMTVHPDVTLMQVDINLTGALNVCPDTTQIYAIAQQPGYVYSIEVTGGTVIDSTDKSNILINWQNSDSSKLKVNALVLSNSCQSQKVFNINITDAAPYIQCRKNVLIDENISNIGDDNTYYYQVLGDELNPVVVSDNCGVMSVLNNYNFSDTLIQGTKIPIVISETTHEATKSITWMVENKGGFQSSCTISIIVTIDDQLIPMSAFSPNGDGINEKWTIINIDRYPEATVQVFNRWGSLVFESKSGYNAHMWEGSDLPMNTYHFMILLNEKVLKRGIVTIVK